MSFELLEKHAHDSHPNLEVAKLKFLLTLPEHRQSKSLKLQFLELIQTNDMAPYYDYAAASLRWSFDKHLVEGMKKENSTVLEGLETEIENAECNMSQLEVCEAKLKKLEYLSRIGDKDNAVLVFDGNCNKTLPLSTRVDIIFHIIRLGFLYMDLDLISRNIETAGSLVEEGADWDRRNRLKTYHAAYALCVRDFKTAANLFLETLSAFAAFEMMDLDTYMRYTVYAACLALCRKELYERVIKDTEVQQGLYYLPDVKAYLYSLYNSQYAEFFQNLSEVEQKLRRDFLVGRHYRFYVREMRIVAYSQLLTSYRSLSLPRMALHFGVSPEFIEEELRRFISGGRLHAKIDSMRDIVMTYRPDDKSWQYQCAIKQGDVLLNRIQKLSRLMEK